MTDPINRRIDDGFSTIITLQVPTTIDFWEKEVTPPGWDGGGANDTTTMRNLYYRTQSPKKLKKMSDASVTVSYNPAVLADIESAININQQITVTFPDGDTFEFWGWLNSFKPNQIKEGEQPTAQIEIMASMQDNSRVETSPTFTAGTTDNPPPTTTPD